MSEDNDRLRQFISPVVDFDRFLHDAQQMKERLKLFQTSNRSDETQTNSLIDLSKTLGDYRDVEVEIDDENPVTTDNNNEINTTDNWRTRRKKTPVDSHLLKNLRSYPACIEYLYREFSQSRPHASHDTAFLKNIRECNQATSTINEPRLIFNVQIFFPIESRDRYRHQLMNELICLSTLTLAQIRDAIECVSDEQILGEFSENPQRITSEGQRAGDVDPSACFIIESNIYDDCRRTETRLSEKILQQINGNYQCGTTMETTTINDLKSVQLGKPYIYLHQTNCEHVIVFSEMKLLEDDQCHAENLYPICRMKYHGRFSYCFLCNVFYAKWLVRNSPLIPDDPCLLCERCFRACHYDQNGNKVGLFSAFHFPQL